MITINGIRNGFWCVVALSIVACASAPMPFEKIPLAGAAVDGAQLTGTSTSDGDASGPARTNSQP